MRPDLTGLHGRSAVQPRPSPAYWDGRDQTSATTDAGRPEQRLGPSLAIYEPGFLRATLAYWRAGRLPAGAMVKLYFSTEHGLLGAPFGLPPTATALDAYLEILRSCDLQWAVSAVGGDVVETEVARLALERGGHIHLGLEFYRGGRQPTDVELVTEAVELCQRAERPVATPDQAAAVLRLPRPRPSGRVISKAPISRRTPER